MSPIEVSRVFSERSLHTKRIARAHVAKRIIGSECVGSLLVSVKQFQTSVQFIYAYINKYKCMKLVYACIDLLINIYMHSPHPNAPELNVWLVGFFNHR